MVAVATSEWTAQNIADHCLDSWREPWTQLAPKFFMQHPAWLINAWTHFHRHSRHVSDIAFLNLADKENEDLLIGYSGWFRHLHHSVQWWRLVGSGQVCSDYVGIPSLEGLEIETALATADWFHTHPRKPLDLPVAIEVEGYRAGDPQWQAFFDRLESHGWIADSVEIEGTWRLEIPENREAFTPNLNRTLRRKVRRIEKAIEKGELTRRACRTPSEIMEAWPDFVRLHQLRRQQVGQPGCFADPHFENFLKTAVLEFADEGVAWLSVVESDGQAISTQLLFDSPDTTYLYQSGLNPSYAKLEPGHAGMYAVIDESIRTGKVYFDLLRGDEPYKKDWSATRTSLQRTVLFSPGISGLGLSTALKFRRSVQGWLKPKS